MPDAHPPTFPLLLTNVTPMQTTYLFRAGLARACIPGCMPTFLGLAALPARLSPGSTAEAG